MADPRALRSTRLIYEIWPVGPKFDTDSRGLSSKATGLHLTGVGEDTLGSTLALAAIWAEVKARPADPRTLVSIRYKTRNSARGSQV